MEIKPIIVLKGNTAEEREKAVWMSEKMFESRCCEYFDENNGCDYHILEGRTIKADGTVLLKINRYHPIRCVELAYEYLRILKEEQTNDEY